MKKILTLAAIIMAAAIPVTVSAETTEELSYGYDNSEKTVLMKMVETAINSGSVTFDTQAHRDAFLSLIDDLYDAVDAGNWNTAVSIANQLRTASSNILCTNQRDLVESLCLCTAGVYSASDLIMLLTPEDEAAFTTALANGGSIGGSGALSLPGQTHVRFKTIIHGCDGDMILLPCTMFIVTYVYIKD